MFINNCSIEERITFTLALSIYILLFAIFSPESANALQDDQNQIIPWIGSETVNVTKEIANVMGMNEPDITKMLANVTGLKEPSGVLVTDVTPGSPAENAGLRGGNELPLYVKGEEVKLGGDIILQADNITITNKHKLESVVMNKEAGDTLKLTILRDSQEKEIYVTVGSNPDIEFVSASHYTNLTNVEFFSYEDFDLGLQIQHPSNWGKERRETSNITFISPPENIEDRARDNITLFVYPISNKTLDEEISVKDPFQNLNIIEQPHTTTLANNHARKLVYSYIDDRHGITKGMNIATQQNDNIYLFRYFAQTPKFDAYLPTIQYMIDTFNILNIRQYESFDLEMRMKYPSSWVPSGEDDFSYSPVTFNNFGKSVIFLPSKGNNSNGFKEHLEIFVSEPYKNSSLAQESFSEIAEYYKTDQNLDFHNFKLIAFKSNVETSQPHYNITYSYGDPDFGIINTMHIITIRNNKLYSASYSAEQEEYPKYLPTIDKMVKSIEFFNAIQYPESNDPNLGVILQYPSDWNKTLQEDNKSIRFSSRFMDSDPPYNDPTIILSVHQKDNSSSQLNKLNYNISIGKVNKTKVYLNTTGNASVLVDKAVFTYQNFDNVFKVMHVTAPFKNNIYDITFFAEADEYSRSLSTAESIIESVKIINETNPIKPFLNFDSPYGFKIMYPIEWEPIDYNNGYIEFFMRSGNDYEISQGTLGISVLPSGNEEFYDTIRSDIAYYTQPTDDLTLIESYPVTDRNYSAYRMSYTDTYYRTLSEYIFENKTGHLYLISYTYEKDKFYNYLPTIKQMIDSFEFSQASKQKTFTGLKVGHKPTGIAVNTNTDMVYVANTDSDTVSVLNGSEILTNIPVYNEPYAVAVNPDKNRIYVTHTGSEFLSVIDGRSNIIIDNISIRAEEPISLAVNPNTDKVYVADAISGYVYVIDGNKNATRIEETGRDESNDISNVLPIGVAVDPIRNRIYVADYVKSQITVIDGIEDKILRNIPVKGQPSDIAINSLTNRAYIVQDINSIVEIDLSTNESKSLNVIGFNFNVLVINQLTNMLYVTDSNYNTVDVIDLSASEDRSAKVEVDSTPSFLTIDEDTNMLYVSNSLSNTVSIIEGSRNQVVAGVTFNIQPQNAGHIKCDGKEYATNTYIRIAFRTQCNAEANNGFEFSSWTENLGGNSSKRLITTIPHLFDQILNALIPNDNYATLNISKHGIFTANFREAPSPIPKEIWISLFGIMLGTILPSVIRWRNGRKQRRNFYKYMQDLPLKYAKLNQNDIDREIIEIYAKGKINEDQHKLLKEKISEHYNNTSKLR